MALVENGEPVESVTHGDGDAGRTCQACGRIATDEDLLQWVMDRRAGRVSWTCPRCAAAHIRSLEAKLDPEWW